VRSKIPRSLLRGTSIAVGQAMGSFFKSEERLGKRKQKGVVKAGGGSHQSIPSKSMHGDSRVALRPPYMMAPA